MNKLESEIDALYERSTKSQSREDFGKLYHADKGNNIEGMFNQVQKLAKVAPVNKIIFHTVNEKSNLTPEQQVAFAKRREAMGVPTADTSKVKLARETIAAVETEMLKFKFFSAKDQESKRKQLLAKAKIEFRAAVNKPATDRYNKLRMAFGSELFNITEPDYINLTEKQKSDAEIDLAIAIKCGKIKCPANYTPVTFTLLDQIRREKGW